MNSVKKQFSIRDLENLSGIKAHTIRIWEKRYNLLSPERTDTNIRRYSTASLQKLLNITLLYNAGYRISKIASLSESEIAATVREIIARNRLKSPAINAFKLAMINFDQKLFQHTLSELMITQPFRKIFWDVFMPFLYEMGMLWQTDTISPAHEHFITNLIKQKICTETEKLQYQEAFRDDKVFVLYLPENEIHEIGLLFINYELVLKGYKTIYLGQTMPIENLEGLQKFYDNLYYLSYFTVSPEPDMVDKYIEKFDQMINPDGESKLWLLGRQTQHIKYKPVNTEVRIFSAIEDIAESV